MARAKAAMVRRLHAWWPWKMPRKTRVHTLLTALLLAPASGCLQTAPPELVQDVEAMDQELHDVGGAEFAPEEYHQFVDQWVVLKTRLAQDDDLIRLPWEPNHVEAEVQRVAEQARKTLSVTKERREARRRVAWTQVDTATKRLSTLKTRLNEVGGRTLVAQQLVETSLLVHQAHTYYDRARYSRAEEQAHLALKAIGVQTVTLTRELSRYTNDEQLGTWKAMAQHTVDWSRRARAYAMIVNKADRQLILYRNGIQQVTIPIRLGNDGILEKHRPGDGATPEGYYHVAHKQGARGTAFHRALLLDYPNGEDRRAHRLERAVHAQPVLDATSTMVAIHGRHTDGLMPVMGGIMLDNPHIEKLYRLVQPGTPVTIVGALDADNPISRILPELAEFAAE